MPSESCDGCATWLEPGGGKKIHLTKGSLCLCEQCLADLNRKNPAIAEVDHLRAAISQRDELCRELATALQATAKWQDDNCWCFGWNSNPCISQPACVKAKAALAHAREQGMLEE